MRLGQDRTGVQRTWLSRCRDCSMQHRPLANGYPAMRWRHAFAIVLAGALHAGLSESVAAQALSGSVRDGATALPIRGAFLELLDSAGKRVVGALSDSAGGFIMRVVAGGYALRAEAMGYEEAEPHPVELVPGVDRILDLRLRPSPIVLPSVRAEVAPRCKLRKDTAGSVLAVWREARRTLRLADWSMRESGLAIVTRGYARAFGDLPRVRWPDSVWVDTVFGAPPFVPVAMATARDSGLFQPRTGAARFYAPGPDYILSDDFLESHCFALRRSGQRIGLDFFPVSKGGEGEIRGTLWLDRDARALQQIEFKYGDVARPVVVRGAEGTLDFASTTEGYSIIRRWIIRVPTYNRGWGKTTKVRGGEVVKSWLAKP